MKEIKKIILKRNEQGITLIALVITIIVLLILAGISIAMITGENGILTQAQRAKTETENAQAVEEDRLNEYEDYINDAIGIVTGGEWNEEKGVNAPTLKGNMELVRYENGEWVKDETGSNYSYVAGSGTADNNNSEWANARVTVDGIESYFVWIPRYEYKIDSDNHTIDVKFIPTTQTTADSGYIIHPAFTNDVNNGGWDSELSGIWVGKYETSLVKKSDKSNVVTNSSEEGNILLSNNTDIAIAIQPGLSSWRYCTIGNQYTNAREYAENLNSHMLKNSEWGAVAYLTHSQYGRNGTEVTINNSSKYITGSAGNSVSAEVDVGIINDYTRSQGVLASSTGNVYGVYDLSGGASESVATYYNEGNNLISYGGSFAAQKKDSTKYATSYTGMVENLDYKLGDATYETNAWNGDYGVHFIDSDRPFFIRGGFCEDALQSGIFEFFIFTGNPGRMTLRMCLVIE